MVCLTHLDQQVDRGEEFSFELVRHWPAKCVPLMRTKNADSFVLRSTSQLQIRSAEYRVILPPGFDAVQELIGATDAGVALTMDKERGKEERQTFVWRSARIPAMTTVGMRLQLTQ